MRAVSNSNIMDFVKALQKVHDVNAVFWNSGRTEIAELRELMSKSSDAHWARESALSKLKTIGKAMANGGADVSLSSLTANSHSKRGTYTPPKLPIAELPVACPSANRAVGAPLAKAIDGQDVDAFFASLELNDEGGLKKPPRETEASNVCAITAPAPVSDVNDLDKFLDHCLDGGSIEYPLPIDVPRSKSVTISQAS